jgi:hypothetical protein
VLEATHRKLADELGSVRERITVLDPKSLAAHGHL